MKILQIASTIPYPVIDGGRAGLYNITMQLLKHGASVHFAAPKLYSNDSHGFSKYVKFYPMEVDPKNKIIGIVKYLFSKTPYNIEKYFSFAALQQLQHIYDSERFDLIHVDSLHMAKYAISLKQKYDIPIVLREHNYQSEILKRYMQYESNPITKIYVRIQYERILKYEADTVKEFDLVLPISKNDENKLIALSPKMHSVVIPGGVDVDVLKFDYRKINNCILFVTNLDWIPNKDGFEYYVKDILPQLHKIKQDIKTLVTGIGTEKLSLRYGRLGVQGMGFLSDFNMVSSLASIAVVPLRIGGGIRMKILELMAMGKIIITTSIGAEGIDVVHGKHIFIADDPKDFAMYIDYALQNLEECQQMARAARKLVVDKYSWDTIGDKMFLLYEDLVDKYKGIKGR